MSQMKFPPESFLEVDDLFGGRKVVMVCRDGVTFWDELDHERVTPIQIHPVINPVSLGGFFEFINARNLKEWFASVVAFLREKSDDRVTSDPLFMVRMLWAVSMRVKEGKELEKEETLAWAMTQAEEQTALARQIHDIDRQSEGFSFVTNAS